MAIEGSRRGRNAFGLYKAEDETRRGLGAAASSASPGDSYKFMTLQEWRLEA